MCSSSRRRIYQKQRFISTLAGAELGQKRTATKEHGEEKAESVAVLVLSWAFVRGSTPSPSAGQRRGMEAYSAEGVVLRKHPSARDGHQLLSVFEAVKGAGGIHP